MSSPITEISWENVSKRDWFVKSGKNSAPMPWLKWLWQENVCRLFAYLTCHRKPRSLFKTPPYNLRNLECFPSALNKLIYFYLYLIHQIIHMIFTKYIVGKIWRLLLLLRIYKTDNHVTLRHIIFKKSDIGMKIITINYRL